MEDAIGCLGWAVLAIILIAFILFAIPAIELWLWGLVMVPVFGAPTMTFWQMFCLNWLCQLLFGARVSVNSSKK